MNTIKIKCLNGELQEGDHTDDNYPMSGFVISRMINGEKVDIELTIQELNETFYYREHECYIDDVVQVLEEFERNGKLYGHTADEIRANESLMGRIVSVYEENREDYEMEWHYAAEDAIKENIVNAKNTNTDSVSA